MPRRATDALLTTVALLVASTVTITTAQDLNCLAFNSSSTAGYPDGVSIATPYYFGCEDGSFIQSVEVSYGNNSYISWLQWTCTEEENWSAHFTVGITGVDTGVAAGDFPYMSEMFFGGYDVDEDEADGMLFSWKGPYGEFSEEYDDVLSGTSASYCGSDAFATGMTVRASTSYLYGVMLECAKVTDTCSPSSYPASLLEDSPSSESSTAESDSMFTGTVIVICASVGGALVLIAIVICVTVCCLRSRRTRKGDTRQPEREPPTATPVGVPTATRERGHAGKGPVPHLPEPVQRPPPYISAHELVPPTDPPPPRAGPWQSYSQETPPPSYYD